MTGRPLTLTHDSSSTSNVPTLAADGETGDKGEADRAMIFGGTALKVRRFAS